VVGPRRLHLGCGAKRLPGFYYGDILDAPHIDRCGHVDDLAFIADGVVELSYACHVLEHFLRRGGFAEARRRDWRRTEHAEVDDYSQAYLPHLDRENGQLMSLNLEAVKGGSP